MTAGDQKNSGCRDRGVNGLPQIISPQGILLRAKMPQRGNRNFSEA
jgi:hypothetical protein